MSVPRFDDSRTAPLAAPMSSKAWMFLTLAYASSRRLSEVCRLRCCDIDSAPVRMCLRVSQGKGAQDRYALLTTGLLDDFRLLAHLSFRGAVHIGVLADCMDDAPEAHLP